jgi:cytosine/adenosine deaminase-related metal-dependent hydrolase
VRTYKKCAVQATGVVCLRLALTRRGIPIDVNPRASTLTSSLQRRRRTRGCDASTACSIICANRHLALQPSVRGRGIVDLTRWFTPAEALAMATSANGELLALSGLRNPYPGKLGVVEQGALADLIVVDGNPLENINLVAAPANKFLIIMKEALSTKTPFPSDRSRPWQYYAASPLLCCFLDAGMTTLSTRSCGRRPKSAKARNRGKWGTGGAAGAMEI